MIKCSSQFIKLCGAFVLLFCTSSSLANPSENSEIVLPEQGQYELEREYQQLSSQLEANPDDLELNFRFAQAAAKLEDYEKAIAAFERMLIKQPNLPRIQLDLAALYLRVGNDGESKRLFEEVLASNPPPQVKENILRMLEYIADNQRKHFLSLAYSLGWNTSSNVDSTPKSKSVEVLGSTFAIDTQNEAEGHVSSNLTVSHSYLFGQSVPHRWVTTARHYRTMQEDSRDKEVTNFSLETGPTFFSENRKLQYGFNIGYEDNNLAHRDYLKSFNKEAFIRYMLSQNTQLSASVAHKRRFYQNTDTVTVYEDLNGCQKDYELQLRTLLSPKDILSFTGRISKEDTRVAYETNREKALNVNYTHILDDTYFITAGAGVRETKYKGSDALVNSTKVREDFEKTFLLGVGANITDNINCSLVYMRQEVDSNILNYEYENDRIMANITWRY